MWTIIKIGMFYAAPVAAVLLTAAWFVLLLLRVRRGALGRPRAALLCAWTLLFPLGVIFLIWTTGEAASYFSAAADDYSWDREASINFLVSLIPLGGYVGAPIAMMNIAFWIALAFTGAGRSKRSGREMP